DGNAAAECKSVCMVFVPVANLCAVGNVRTAESPYKAFYPVDAVRERCSAGCGDPECNRLGAAFLAYALECGGDLFQRLFPADPLPAGVCRCLGGGAPHGMQDAMRAVHQLGRGPAFGAQRVPCGMAGVGLDTNQCIVMYRVKRATTRTTQGAIATF